MVERKQIIVTGGSGQLGNEFREIADAHPQFEFLLPSSASMRIDDEEAVRDFFHATSPAYCINCAAYTAVDKAETDQGQAFLVNGQAVGTLATICKEFDTHLVHISTDYVFDGTATTPYGEDTPTNPVNAYGASKLEGEQSALAANNDAVIIRTSWVYSRFGKNFVKTMLRLMAEKSSISVVNDQFGSPTYAADLAGVVMEIISSGDWHPGVFHFSNSGQISWFDFAVAIRDYARLSCEVLPITTAQFPTPAKRPAYSVLSNHKIESIYGITTRDWKESLKTCLNQLQPPGNVKFKI